MVNNQINKLISVESIFEYFKNSGYIVETDEFAFPLSELIEKPIEGDVWTVIDTTNLTVLIIKASKYNRRSYRNKINTNLKGLVGTKIIFFTCDFNDYNLTLIFDGIFNIKFNPSNPDMLATRIFESIESKENLFDYTKQDINFTLLKRELTTNALMDGIREGDNSSVKLAFQEGGLNLIGKGANKVIISHDDAPVKDLMIDVKLEYEQDELNDGDLKYYIKDYKMNMKRELKLCCLISNKGLIYHWIPYSLSGFIGFKNELDEDITDDVLETLIAQASYRTAFNSETFHQQFGMNSPFFLLGKIKFNEFFKKKQKHIEILYNEWKERFSKVYHAGDLDSDLFIKHSYLSLLIKIVLYSKFVDETNKDNSTIVGGDLSKIVKVFESRGVPIFFNDFFQWSTEEKLVQNEIFEALKNAEFYIDDLFKTVYQEMVSPETRHALGEFYTPTPLAEKMVEEVYNFGDSALDPSCGSGTFLVELFKKIYESNHSLNEKIQAVSKIYGFDINPIAILVARANILLIGDKIFGKDQKIPINVYLADSLSPIDEFDISGQFKTLDKWGTTRFGEAERFNMQSVNDSLVINIKFFNYLDEFGKLLKELDKNFSLEENYEKILELTYKNVDNLWLDENCEGSSKETLRDNFEYVAKKLYDLLKSEKNHIWAYLLFNALGVRKMKKSLEGVDLLVGNPPWLTLNEILSYDYKEQIKNYANNLGIYVGGKQAPNTEICSIFFYRTANLYLKNGGKIFFVTPRALETGEQNSKFRLFKGFKDVFIWKFLKLIFRINNICIGATLGKQSLIERLNIKVKIFDVNKKNGNLEFELKTEEINVPYNIKTISKDEIAKRLINPSKLKRMLPIKDSYYKNKFKKGADIYPRTFFFIIELPDGFIVPDKSLIQKKPWNFYPINNFDIELNYIFTVCKSTDLVSFSLLKIHKCFLPIEKRDLKFHKDLIKPKAKKLFSKISGIYTEIQERDQREITNLWDNMNRFNKLSNPMQHSKIKVIYNASGSNLKAAILTENMIVDLTLLYIGLDDLDEAYYICTILNSSILTKNLKLMKSSRHLLKRALEFPIPKYYKDDEIHKTIVNKGKTIETEIKSLINSLRKKELNKVKNKIECKHCGKRYSKSSFERYRETHEKSCREVSKECKWSLDDWVDLNDITLNKINLGSQEVQNVIYNNENLKEKFEELDKLVIQLLKSKN